MASVSLTCSIEPAEGAGNSIKKVCDIPTGEDHLRCLSASLKDLQKEVNDSLTVLVEKEKGRGLAGELAMEEEHDSKGEWVWRIKMCRYLLTSPLPPTSDDSEGESDEEGPHVHEEEGAEPESKKSKS